MMRGEFKLQWVLVLVFVIILSLPACRKEAGTEEQVAASVAAEIDSEKIAADVGVRFRVIKTKALGESPRHKFYCVAVAEKTAGPKLEELAAAIVRETIAARPRTYHSFTVHFFWENELKETPEKSTPFARATYLPEGSWLKVGRASIEDYKDYRLTCVRLDKQ
jgi:hypothetical protein